MRALAVAAGALSVAACGSGGGAASPSGGAASTQPIILGAILPMTGSFGVIGQEVAAGLHVAVDQINGKGGIMNRRVDLVIEDDQSTAAKAATATSLLLDQEHADLLEISPIATEALASLPITTQRKVITFTQSGTPVFGDSTKYPYNFMYSIPFQVQALAVAFEAQQLGAKRVGLLALADTSGKAAIGAVQDEITKNTSLGMQVVDSEGFDSSAQDVTGLVAKLKAANPDLLILQTPANALGVALRAVQQLGWKDIRILATNGTVTGDISKLIPDTVTSQFQALVVKVLARSKPDALDPQYDAFAKQAVHYMSTIPSLQASLFASDVAHIVGWAVQKAGSTTPDKVRTALESVSKASIPGLFAYSNPAFTAAHHDPQAADFSQFWALITSSTPLDGTFVGRVVNIPALRANLPS
jgi:branched-chain amino acid transport system substrate-binding protein